MAKVTLTDNERRQLETYAPYLSPNPPGADLASLLEKLGNILTGTATVLDGNTSVVVAVGAEYDGLPVVCTFGEEPTAAAIVSATVASGNLTITIDADNTADLLVHYMIDGRA